MKKYLFYIIPLIFILYYGFYFFVENTGAEYGEMAPDFETELVDGSPFKLSNLRGGYVLLDFWGSWCGPCRAANPKLVSLQKEYPLKITIVTVALEKSGQNWKKAAELDGFTWKHQIVEFHNLVMLSDIARAYGAAEIPQKFLISPEGMLLPKMTFEEISEVLDGL